MTEPNPWRRVAILACVIAGSALAITGVFLVVNIQRTNDAQAAAHEAQAAVDLVVQQRTEARLQACLKDKKFADAHNGLILYLANTKPQPSEVRTAEQRAARSALIADFEAKNLVPVPDCSPAGIAAFYAGQGGTTTPATPDTTTTAPPPASSSAPRPTTSQPTATTGTTTTVYRSQPNPTSPPTTCMVTIPGVKPCL